MDQSEVNKVLSDIENEKPMGSEAVPIESSTSRHIYWQYYSNHGRTCMVPFKKSKQSLSFQFQK